MNKQNLQTELMVLCDYASISKEGKLSAVGIFDELLNTVPPIVLNKGFVVATVTGSPNTNYRMFLKVEHGNKKENLIPTMEVNIQTGSNGKSNLVIEVQGITFPQPGNYNFKLYSDGEEVGSKELIVKKVNATPSIKMPN